MGQLDIACFATEETTKVLYAFSYAYDNNRSGYSGKQVGALIKSNAAPTPDTLTWSLVSFTSASNIFTLTSYSCIVDPNGAFTMFGVYSNSGKDRPGGFRYDPTLTTGNGTSGTWTKIDIPIDYAWSETSYASAVFYLKNAAGKYDIYHAFAKSTPADIRFGALNTATNTMENSNATWAFPNISVRPKSLLATSTTLLVWDSVTTAKRWVATLPPGPLTSTPPTLREVNFPFDGTNCAYAYIAYERYFHCTNTQTYGSSYVLYRYDGNMSLPMINATGGIAKSTYADNEAAVVGDGNSSFMVVQSEHLRYYGGNDNYMVSTVVVTGPAAGTVKSIPNGFSVPENLSYKEVYTPPPPPTSSNGGSYYPGPSGSGSGSGSDDSSVSTGFVVAIVAVVVIAITALFFVVRWRMKAGHKTKPPGDGVVEPSPYTQGPVYPQPVPQPVPQPAYPQPAYSQPAYPQPVPPMAQGAPDGYPHMAGGPMTTAGAVPDASMFATSSAFAATLPSFSSHPRPNVVTSVSGNPNPVIDPILGQDPSAVPWTPAPFDPHAGTAVPSSAPSPADFGTTSSPSPALSAISPALPAPSPSISAGFPVVASHGSPGSFATTADRPLPALPQEPPAQVSVSQAPVTASPPIPAHTRPSNPQLRAV
ncbi:hypothetical protein DFQ27_001240 [Actinomortierella ambigua]|uniref:Uncharacterized protein n=1 Tax=Actinomortierella ambigua TaxID=1343610 RepID=A0A9P6QIR4_9FUNG|nr:hypothetical protein DFQ27_001240 [Actinomortierella ambigua]